MIPSSDKSDVTLLHLRAEGGAEDHFRERFLQADYFHVSYNFFFFFRSSKRIADYNTPPLPPSTRERLRMPTTPSFMRYKIPHPLPSKAL